MLAIFAAAAVGGYVYVTKYIAEKNAADDFPTFPLEAAPFYRSASFRSVTVEGGETTTGQIDVDAQDSIAQLTLSDTNQHVIVADGFAYTEDGAGSWIRLPLEGELQFLSIVAQSLRVHTFAELVPELMQPYTTITKTEPASVSGHEVTTYQLQIQLAEYAKEEPADFARWADVYGFDGDEPPTLANLSLSVDADGIVWESETWDDTAPTDSRSTETLLSYSDDDSGIEVPVTFTDAATNVAAGATG